MPARVSVPVRSVLSRPGMVTKPLLLHTSRRPFSSAKSTSQKQVKLTSQDNKSRRRWAELSKGQKVVRTASTGANFLTIIVGVVLTGTVFTLLYTEVFAPNSTANWFNRIHNRIKKDPRCTKLLGDGKRIRAYGEPTSNRWSRNRPIASSTHKDLRGTEHLVMHFNVEGDIDKGVVNVHLTKKVGESDYEYKYLFLDVPDKPRVYLENVEDKVSSGEKKKKGLFGIQWGW